VTIKLGAGNKPLMVGGKVVTNCDCCAAPPECSAGSFCDGADCAIDTPLYATFAGITACAGCIDFTFVNPDTSRQITGSSLNGTVHTDCATGAWSGSNAAITIDYNFYQDNFCGDLQGTSTGHILSCVMWCDGFTLRVALTDNFSVMFYGPVCFLDTTYDNQCACGMQFAADTIPPGAGFGKSIGCGTGGTVIVKRTP
jgi:hypothetical protein